MHRTYYAMFSNDGNDAVSSAVAEFTEGLTALTAQLRGRFTDIATVHRELGDTAVREIIYGELTDAVDRLIKTGLDPYNGVVEGNRR